MFINIFPSDKNESRSDSASGLIFPVSVRMKLMKSSSAAVIVFWVKRMCWVKSVGVLSLASGMVTEGSIEKVPIPGRFNFFCWYRYLANKADSFKIYGFVLHKLKI